MGNEVSMVYIDGKGEDLPEMGRGIRAGRARGDPCVQLGIRKWED